MGYMLLNCNQFAVVLLALGLMLEAWQFVQAAG
jgi:hypothetical protein